MSNKESNNIQEELQEFIDLHESENTKKVIKHIVNKLDLETFKNISTYNIIEIEDFIIKMKPDSPKKIISICYVLNSYAKWKNDKGLSNRILSTDRDRIWELSKPMAKKKFITNKLYEETIHNIDMYEDLNALTYMTLFMCIYEGIYNDDLSVIKNLRGSDIRGNVVTVREDNGKIYKINISNQLANNLIDLSKVNEWYRKNRYGIFTVPAVGEFEDTCFKFEARKGSNTDKYRYVLYSKLRKISDDYLEYNLLPLQLFISGIMFRIKKQFDQNGLTLEDEFVSNKLNRQANSIIEKELKRSHYDIDIRNFREVVKGHLDVFSM